MKTIILVLSVLFLIGLYFQKQNNSTLSNNENTNFQRLQCPEPPSFLETVNNISENSGSVSDNKDIDQNWYQSAMKNIENEEYNISYNEELGAYQSPNRANNIRFIYHKNGFTAKTRSKKIQLFDMSDKTIPEEDKKYETIDEWSIDFKLQNEEYKITNCELKASGNKASIENENIRIDYTNEKEGMRQDFIIKKKLEEDGILKLNISADTKLKMIVGADALMFKDNIGSEKMKYSALKVWDSNGKDLRAFFKKDDLSIIENQNSRAKNSNSFTIIVNDEGAVYPITIDPLSTTPNWTAENNQAGALYGSSATTAGDVNGDGYSDVIVGAYRYDNGQSDEGRAFVYLGSATGLSASPNWTAESDQAAAWFGYCVSTAGDVNGDGYSDVIVGAYGFDNGQSNEGRAYVFQGSNTGLSITPNWITEIDQTNSQFGYSVSTLGDVNGDGFSDIIVGANSYDNGEVDEGKAFVYHGSSLGLSTSVNWTAESNQFGALFANSTSTAGDVNGDGFSDAIIGAPNFDNGQTDEGSAFIYHGSATGLSSISNRTLECNQAFALFGISVSTAGNVNGDGYSDVIIGASEYDNGQSNEGRAFVYHGSSSGISSVVRWTAESNQIDAKMGISVFTAGDVNGDGYSDVIVGAYWYDNGETNEGKVYMYQGSSIGLNVSANWTKESDQANAYFGYSVSTAGDVNGDGFSDVIIGAYLFDNGESNEGSVFLYQGSGYSLSITANLILESNQSSSFYGMCVSAAGDVNGDGYSDVIVGAPNFDNGQTDEGRAYVYHGSATGLSISPNWVSESNQSSSDYGRCVSTAGDVNGDGYSDVIIGAKDFDNGQSDEGRAFVFHGSPSGLSSSANWTAESNQAFAFFGLSVSTAGDVNGDGYSDVIVGAIHFDNGQLNEGKVYVYYGSASGISTIVNWSVEINQENAQFGWSVASAGDVNGDGYSDVIVGARLFDNGHTDVGKAFVYHGSKSGLLLIPSWTAEGNLTGTNLGKSVSTAGDVNGDGYSDVIVGNNQNIAYVYYGSESGLSLIVNWTQSEVTLFAHSVSTAGDVNGDGYSDVIAGVYVYHGSNTGLSTTSQWTYSPPGGFSFFGESVSTAGDVNGDGFSDIIIGDSYINLGGSYIFYGNSGNGLNSTIRQYKPGTNNIVYSGGMTGTDGEVRLNISGRSPFGRADGKIVYEYKYNGEPFSGSIISNSTSYSGEGPISDFGTSSSGSQFNFDISGLMSDIVYKWRARTQYSLINNPYQRYGPWKYYNNYIPTPIGNFRPSDGIPSLKQLDLTVLIQGFYSSGSNEMIQDTVTVVLRNSEIPYAIVDSTKAFLSTSGQGIYLFSKAVNLNYYFLQLKHRNSIETWSKTPLQFVSNMLSYDFTTANTQSYGDNVLQVDNSPIKYAIYNADVNQDGVVDLSDLSIIDASYYGTGYIPMDVNGDGVVDISDSAIADNNSYNFVGMVTP